MKNVRFKRLLSTLLAATLVSGSVFTSFAAEEKVNEAATELTEEAADFEWEELDEEILDTEEDVEVEQVEESEPEFADDDQVRVFIVFDGKSVVDAGYDVSDITDNKKAMAYSDKLEAKQDKVIDKIEDSIDESIETRYSFTLLTNAVSCDVTYANIEVIEEVSGVAGVYIAPVYETQATTADPQTITSGDMVGSYDTWTNGYTGAGMRVAIIDTGLDSDHPSFDGDAYLYSLEEVAKADEKAIADYDLLDEAEIAGALDKLNAKAMKADLTADDLYRTAKVAYGFNYVDEDLDITHDNDTAGDHGTHVAGITTANRYVKTADGYDTQAAGVVGVAPEAQLMVMKVFGKGGGAYTDDYMAAIEDALVLGADAINLSLGSSNAGVSAESAAGDQYVNEIFDKLVGGDSIVSISAGNAGSWADNSQYGVNLSTDVSVDTVGSPGSYTNALTVASAVNCGYTGYAAKFDDTCNVYYADAADATMSTLDTNGTGTEYDYVLLTSKGEAADYEGLDVEGKIVLVSRGAITFSEKHMNAAKAGAIGVFVYNNTSGTISMSLSGSDATIPCASIKLSDANAIAATAKEEENGTYTGKVVINSKVSTNLDVEDGYTMSDFSSWGVPGSLELKPEITAPGGNIYSTINDGQYGLMSGTSMSAPSVTGLSALTIQYIEDQNLVEATGLSKRTLAQSLLMSTAIPLTEKNGAIYSPRKQGAGLGNVYAATTTPAYILVGDKAGNDGKVKVELGDDPERTGSYSFSFDVYSLNGETSYYVVDSSVLTETAEEYEGLNYTLNTSYELSPSVKISADNSVLLFDIDADGDVDQDDATALLKHVNGTATSDFVSANEEFLDINNNGVVDTADVRSLLAAVNGKSSKADLASTLVAVEDKTTVNVSINLSEADREYIDSTFENGMYVEGFIYLNGGVTLSVPFLSFYGNWTDSSMFEPYDYLEDVNGGETLPTYSGIKNTNFLSYKFAESEKAYYYKSNMYETDSAYLPERNAISSESGDKLTALTFTLIRNAATVKLDITDAATGEVYYSVDKGATDGTFYYASQAKWYYTSSSVALDWAGTDADGEPLFDGTKVNITLTALPEYYLDGTKTPGKGTTLSFPMTIDNEAPSAVLKSYDDEKKTMVVEAQDTNFVSAIYVYANDKKTVLNSYAVNQEKAGEPVELTIEYPETVFYVTVLDYAGNAKSYRVNKSGMADTTVTDGLTLSASSLEMMLGSTSQLVATVSPINLTEAASKVTWTSSDDAVVSVDADGVLTANAVGTATITATTKAKDANGERLTATCEVKVFTLDIDLNCTLWDERGQVHFGSFNTSSVPTLNKISDSQSAPFWAATVVGDNTLICTTYNEDDSKGGMYKVDPVTFESTQLATGYWNTDLAYGEVNDAVYGTYGEYVIITDPSTGEMVGAANYSKYLKGTAYVGIAYAGMSIHSTYGYVEWFYLIDNVGVVYQMGYVWGLGSFFYELGETGISTNGEVYYSSLYYDYDEDCLILSSFDGSDQVSLYGITVGYDEETDTDTVDKFSLGKFGDKIWPISGLYQFSGQAGEAKTEGLDLVNGFEAMSLTSIPEGYTIPSGTRKAGF